MKRFSLKITVEGPFISAASTVDGFGVDSPVMRNHKGEPIIPGTQVLGKLRHFGDDRLKAILGAEGANLKTAAENRGWEPQRSDIFISDLVLENAQAHKDFITRIAINPDTQTVADRALQIIETVLKPGEEGTFSGEMILYKEHDIQDDIEAALYDAYQIGAFRSIGYGKITDIDISPLTAPENSDCTALEDQSRFSLDFKDIFCIAKPQRGTGGNVFESEEIVPGGVIKGAIANMLSAQHATLKENLHLVRICHAKPSERDIITRGKSVPVSTVLKEGNVAFLEDLGDDLKNIDIKLKEEARQKIRDYFAVPKISRTMRVRSAIEAEKRRSKDEALFAYEAVLPFAHLWVFDTDFTQIPENARETVKKQFWDCVKNGVYRIGKTDARADVSYLKYAPDLTDLAENQSYKIITETDAEILTTDNDLSKVGGLKEAYAAYFKKYGLTLTDFYTEEALVGGEYLKNRFGISPYLPKILTKAGSVFIVTPDRKGIETLKEWRQYGLNNRFSCYTKSPYVRNNGYGEIRIEAA